MKIAIMQPYFFPYIGYFQLINAVDSFVVYDDVNYIKQGWINRNYILLNGTRQLITLETRGSSSFKPINQIDVGFNNHKLIKTIHQAYIKAPYFKSVFQIIEDCLRYDEQNLAKYVFYSVKKIAEYINIKTSFILSSDIEKENDYKGQKKVLHICNLLSASEYINAIGGISLYSKDIFKIENIKLRFLRTRNISYNQFMNLEFVPNLSIIDMLMFCHVEEIQALLDEYDLE